MITCNSESLVFEHPETSSALERCGEQHLREWLPHVLSADLPTIARKLLATEFSHLSPKRRETVMVAIHAATPERIETRFRKMILRELKNHAPTLQISFQRTLRLPDDGQTYPLPPGLDCFPLRRIERHADRVPADWLLRGGVLMPLHQAEALWLHFSTDYPFALKVGTGMINAVSGEPWRQDLSRDPQDYLVLPEQPWLDGYCVGKGVVRQFVAARLADGYTAEEQLQCTTRGGLQLEVVPLRPEVYFRHELRDRLPKTPEEVLREFLWSGSDGTMCYSLRSPTGMGLGAGGTMRQEIYADPWEVSDWDRDHPSRVWVHLCDAACWLQITGELPPQEPLTASEYAKHGLPWFDYYRDDLRAIDGSPTLAKLKSVFALAKANGDASIPPEKTPVTPTPVIALGPHAPGPFVAEWNGN